MEEQPNELLSTQEHLELVLRLYGYLPFPPEEVARHKRKAERRMHLVFAPFAVVSCLILWGLMVLVSTISLGTLASIAWTIGTTISIAVSAGLTSACFLEIPWKEVDYEQYEPVGVIPTAVRQVVDELDWADYDFKFRVHYAGFDPLLEVYHRDASAIILMWPYNRANTQPTRWVEDVPR